MAVPLSRLFDLALALLTAVEDGAAAEGVTLPARRYVAHMLPSADCDQLTVHVERTFGYEGALEAEQLLPQYARAGHALRGATYVVQLWRCVPALDDNGNPPTAAALQASAQEIDADAVLLVNSVLAAERAGDLPGCSGVAIENWTPLTASGGLGGGELRVRVTLGGG